MPWSIRVTAFIRTSSLGGVALREATKLLRSSEPLVPSPLSDVCSATTVEIAAANHSHAPIEWAANCSGSSSQRRSLPEGYLVRTARPSQADVPLCKRHL